MSGLLVFFGFLSCPSNVSMPQPHPETTNQAPKLLFAARANVAGITAPKRLAADLTARTDEVIARARINELMGRLRGAPPHQRGVHRIK